MNLGAIKKLIGFLGYGDNSSAKLWFVGIEEASGYTTLDELKNIPDKELVTCDGCKSDKTSVYVIISKIVLALLGEDWKYGWRDYRDKRLFSIGSEAVQINLYPLGKQRVQNWPNFYDDFFMLTREQYYDMIENHNSGRFEIINRFRNENSNPLSFCFGLQFWSSFEKCFKLMSHQYLEIENNFRIYYDDNIVFAPFFRNNSMSNKRIEILIEKLNLYNINPIAKHI